MWLLPTIICAIFTTSGILNEVTGLGLQDNGGLGSSSGGAVSHFEPQVAMLCDSGMHGQEAYHPKYMTEQGEWVSDLYSKATCYKDKMDILNYCKKVYPKRDITNIVESSHYLKIGAWCRAGSSTGAQTRGKCKTARWVKPFRCLDNLKPKKPVDLTILKKEQEAFDTVDDDDDEESEEEIDKDDLEDLADETELSDDPTIDDEDDDDDDDIYDEDIDWDTTPSSTTAGYKSTIPSTTPSTTTTERTTTIATPDPYFTHFDPRNEHESYKQAQERLEETHREKVTRVMKDWSDLEERYQDMRQTDPRGADEFKQRMTQRFQQTVQALEEEGDAEKHQLAAMHQQRVLAHINQRKKEAMSCYTQALNDVPPNTHRVQKCLQKLLRSLHKDRAHAISHYRHLLANSIEAAAREQPRTLERLTDIDRTVNQSMQMLQRYPDLAAKIGQLMDDYIQALRSKDETPGSLLAMTSDAEQAILDKYKSEVATKQAERERQRIQEKERKEQRKKEKSELKEEKKRVEEALGKKISNFDDEDMEDESLPEEKSSTTSLPTSGITFSEIMSNSITATSENHNVDDAAVQEAVEQVAKAASHRQDIIRVAHVMSHDLSHGEPTYSVRREIFARKDGKSVYFTLAFAGMALMAALVVGVAVARRKTSRSPQSQGFVEVDQAATPEERHVANMQINGYENPTYKYFEVKE
ncbi:amyloid-beta-like protein [Diabrotica undecimpunctata]|uniref:amyloid-beta-like protein n=1 Tax=Diabrotica undecimpunctata TaxID=50387 RepID=UPI003B63D285